MTRKQTKLQLAQETEQRLRLDIQLLADNELRRIRQVKDLETDLKHANIYCDSLKERVVDLRRELSGEYQKSLWTHVREHIGF